LFDIHSNRFAGLIISEILQLALMKCCVNALCGNLGISIYELNYQGFIERITGKGPVQLIAVKSITQIY
jgi:hypothetical protein